jgi:hypothetical protein
MLSISRFSASAGLGMDFLGEALLSLSFLRAGVHRRGSVEQLNDHLRRDVGLPPRERAAVDPRHLRW